MHRHNGLHGSYYRIKSGFVNTYFYFNSIPLRSFAKYRKSFYAGEMNGEKVDRWGDWVARRAYAVGLMRLKDIAEKVGCTPERITQWTSLKDPPKQMRKGFDYKLAWALKTSPEMLFKNWAITPPDKARELIFNRDVKPDARLFERQTNRQLLQELFDGVIFPNLTDLQMEELAGSALAILALSHGPVTAEILRGASLPFLDRLKSFYALASRPPREWQFGDDTQRRERPPTREEHRAFLEQLRQENILRLPDDKKPESENKKTK